MNAQLQDNFFENIRQYLLEARIYGSMNPNQFYDKQTDNIHEYDSEDDDNDSDYSDSETEDDEELI